MTADGSTGHQSLKISSAPHPCCGQTAACCYPVLLHDCYLLVYSASHREIRMRLRPPGIMRPPYVSLYTSMAALSSYSTSTTSMSTTTAWQLPSTHMSFHASTHRRRTNTSLSAKASTARQDGVDPFRTVLNVPAYSSRIQHEDRLLFIGSCFTDNMGQRFHDMKWLTCVNPCGIIYNPVSIAQSVHRLCEGVPYTLADLGCHQGLYYRAEECLSRINDALLQASKAAAEADWVFLTLGTAWAYEHKASSRIVANCHKLPPLDFNKVLLSVKETGAALEQTVTDLQRLNPKVTIVLTLSPVRHIKDGIVESSRSKAHLLSAVHHVVDSHPAVSYFPAYEIVMDDLRDYRFYEPDMLHPSPTAVDYIYKSFCRSYVDKKAVAITTELESLQRALSHRPFHPEAQAHQDFLRNQLSKVQSLRERHPYMDLRPEEAAIRAKLIPTNE